MPHRVLIEVGKLCRVGSTFDEGTQDRVPQSGSLGSTDGRCPELSPPRDVGLTRAQVAFWDIHEEADKDHSDVGDHIVVRHAATEEWQQKVRLALNCSLDMWWQFFEGVEQAIAVS